MSKVSVIIPSFNCESYIAETIESVLKQTYTNIELIVVDDGSTDKTVGIVSSYGTLLRLINQQNAGVCKARNKGISEATGDYICFLDHDDFWLPDKIELQLQAFQKNPDAGLVFSEYHRWFPNGDGHYPSPSTFMHQNRTGSTDPNFSGWIYHQLLLDCCVLTSASMLKKEVFEQCGCFDESLPFSEDWDLWLRISRDYNFVKLSDITTLYRQHPHQGSRSVRDIDYRTELLINTAKTWGLRSRDGRCLSKADFEHKLAFFSAEHGLNHMGKGKKHIAIKSLIRAWVMHPTHIRYLAYLIAGILGWKPSW